MDTHSDLRLAFAERALELFDETGDPRFKAAAGVLRAERIGRPECDDSAALEFASTLMASGTVRSRNQALRRAAVLHSDGDLDSAVRRLSRKYDKNI